jgi:hypothetical protein
VKKNKTKNQRLEVNRGLHFASWDQNTGVVFNAIDNSTHLISSNLLKLLTGDSSAFNSQTLSKEILNDLIRLNFINLRSNH